MSRPKSGNFDQQKYVNDYCKEKYDRCIFNVPKGKKAVIEAHRKKKGYKSLNQYVNDLIDTDLRADEQAATADQRRKPDLPEPGIKVARL